MKNFKSKYAISLFKINRGCGETEDISMSEFL